jgi:TonB family protein
MENKRASFLLKDNNRIILSIIAALIIHLAIVLIIFPFIQTIKEQKENLVEVNFEGTVPVQKIEYVEDNIAYNDQNKQGIQSRASETIQNKIAEDTNKAVPSTDTVKTEKAAVKDEIAKQDSVIDNSSIKNPEDKTAAKNDSAVKSDEKKETPFLKGDELSSLDNALNNLSNEGGDDKANSNGKDKEGIQWNSSGIKRTVLFKEKFSIPKWVEEEGLRLETQIEFQVLQDGNVGSVKIIKTSGYSDFDSLVINTFKRWKFNPVKSNIISKGTQTIQVSF